MSTAPLEAAELVVEGLRRREPAHRPLFLRALMAHAAAGLALWGACVVSTVDNIIKPIVLHGQSKLHPLLALLSVLGGVGALGPIGIFVGPIAVACLQAALTMLQAEIVSLSGQNGTDLAGGAVMSGTDGVAQRGVERVKSS